MRKRVIDISHGLIKKEPNYVYYWLRFLVGLAYGLISPIYALFLFRFGLDAYQVSLTNLVYVIVVIIFQLPAGALADAWGRKKTFLCSTVFNLAAYFIYAGGRSWPVFMVAEALSALGTVLMVGVLEAWVADAWILFKKNKQNRPEQGFIFSRAEMASSAASLVGGFTGGILGAVSLRLPFLVGGLIHLSVLLVGFFLMEEKRSESKISLTRIWAESIGIAKEGVRMSLQNSAIWIVALYAGIMMFGYKALDIFWSQRFVILSGGKVWITGYIWALVSVFMTIGSYLFKLWRDRRMSYFKIFVFMSLFAGGAIALSTISTHLWMAVFFFLWYELTRGMSRPALYGYINQRITSEQRATVLSFAVTVAWIGGGLGLLVLGWVAKRFSIESSWIVATVVFGLALIPLIKIKNSLF